VEFHIDPVIPNNIINQLFFKRPTELIFEAVAFRNTGITCSGSPESLEEIFGPFPRHAENPGQQKS
jgi:hypothetical protein